MRLNIKNKFIFIAAFILVNIFTSSLYAEETTKSLLYTYSKLEEGVLAGGEKYVPAVEEFLVAMQEYEDGEAWKYLTVQKEELTGTVDCIQNQAQELLDNTSMSEAEKLSHLLGISQCIRVIYQTEDSIQGKTLIIFIILTSVVIVLCIVVTACLFLNARISQKAEQIKKDSERNALISKITLKVQEEERKRIYRDLHDTVSQNLGAISILFSQLVPYIKSSEEADSLKDRITALNHTNIEDIHSIIRNATPPEIESEDFKFVIEDLCSDFSSYRGIPCKCFFKDYENPQVQKQLNSLSVRKKLYSYRIVQESLNNAARHASPSEVSVLIRCTPEAALFFITDDGCGFDSIKVMEDETHLGLRGMYSRAAEINANLSVSSDEDGTEIRLEVPYEQVD